MMMQMVGAFAEFERAMLRERTKAGLETARQEGRIGGRRAKLSHQQQAEIRKMVSKGDKTAADAARLFKIHPATVSRLLARPATTVFRKKEYPNRVDRITPNSSESDTKTFSGVCVITRDNVLITGNHGNLRRTIAPAAADYSRTRRS
jgi:hypothetical protein